MLEGDLAKAFCELLGLYARHMLHVGGLLLRFARGLLDCSAGNLLLNTFFVGFEPLCISQLCIPNLGEGGRLLLNRL